MTNFAPRPVAASTPPTSIPVSPVSLAPVSQASNGEDTEAFYLHAKVFATLQRAAARQGAPDWRDYARQRLNAELAAHALPLDPAQAEAVRQYAQALDLAPEEVLAQLLAPEMVRRDRRRRQVVGFVQRHHPRSPRGCLLPFVWGLALLGLCSLVQLVAWLGVMILHMLH